jgi:hypothetical protein
MGLFNKIKKAANSAINTVNHAQQDVIQAIQYGAVHAATELVQEASSASSQIVNTVLQQAKITMDQLDELQKEILKSAQCKAEEIINDAKHETIHITFQFITSWLLKGSFIKKLIGNYLYNSKDEILKELDKI